MNHTSPSLEKGNVRQLSEHHKTFRVMDNSKEWERNRGVLRRQREGFLVVMTFHSSGKWGLTKSTLLLCSLLVLLTVCPQGSFCKGGGGAGGGVTSDEREDSSSAGVGDSVEEDTEMEMSDYLDDEVRFVTEDDLYEEERSHYSDFHQV